MPKVVRFLSGYFPLYEHLRRKIQGKSLRKDGQMTGALIFKQNNSRMVEYF
jgi:hypothetical protein